MHSTLLTATKEFSFDCAHVLTGHEGLCQNLHGHTYKLQVTVARLAEEVEAEGPSAGMVIDFSHLKKLVKSLVVDFFDHATVISNSTYDNFEVELADLCKRHGKKVAYVEYRPTAENMVSDFYNRIQAALIDEDAPIRVVRMRLYETPTSYAEITI